ncbi:Transcription factor UNE10 [Vitis vinifera]|uniref:Transcription factor UNE10 n=1 Tax=Vitis vinifera TaxID=29760 RepID=A0A438BW73_VITVI|nr:Transcription factor UNE10 [Vitis vinifera]
MSQCVPSWDIDDNPTPPRLFLRSHSNSTAPDVPMLDYEVAELTWENGQLAMHGLGQPRVPAKPVASAAVSKYPWEKPRAGGTLESIVNQATRLPHHKPPPEGANDDLVPWLDHQRAVAAAAAAASVAMTMDALVPCSNNNNTTNNNSPSHVMDSVPAGLGPCGGAAPLASAPAAAALPKTTTPSSRGSARKWRVCPPPTTGAAETRASPAAPLSTLIANRRAGDEEDKKRGTGKSSVSSKRSRAAAIHNQSERNEHVTHDDADDPAAATSNVTDGSDGHGMGMSPMGMGVVDMNTIARPNVATTGISPLLHPTPFLPLTAWDVSGDRLPAAPTMVPDPLAAFLACQSQPMTMDAYSRMAALYQHLHQHPASSARSQGL